MKDIDQLLKNTERYNTAIIHKKFKSKKNTVAYITINGKPRIMKWFSPGFKRQMKTEYLILKNGSPKLHIPFLYEIDEDNNVLLMSYIIGENLCEIIHNNNTTTNEKKRLMVLLSKWFVDFHTYFKTEDQFHIRGDSILRNFIFADHIWGVDFEESRIGNPTEDIAGICSSLLSNDPMFTSEKLQLCITFIKSYEKMVKWTLSNINDEIAYALLEKIQWRSGDEKKLRKFAKKIREQGLV